VQIQAGQHPYRQLIKIGIEQGRRPKPSDSRLIMSKNWSPRETADAFGISVDEAKMLEIEDILSSEVDSIRPFGDGVDAVALLQQHGIRVAVCSNLAKPYGEAVKRCFPQLDAYLLSYEVGTTKPDPRIYQACCLALEAIRLDTAMIGDSLACDKAGPSEFGMTGFYLDRSLKGGDYSNLLSFAQHITGAT
jgi:HAD superfamily hydrolase (TIGR01549 family)